MIVNMNLKHLNRDMRGGEQSDGNCIILLINNACDCNMHL